MLLEFFLTPQHTHILKQETVSGSDWMGDLVYVQLTEDRSLLAGYVSMFLGEFNAAQDLGHMQVCTSLQTDNHAITV